MAEKSMKPRIRFKGYTDAWEQRKLGDIADRVVRKNSNLESTLPLTISAQYGLVDQVEYFNNRVASRDVSGYYLVKNGEFAYNKSYSDGYPYGAIKRLDLYKMGVLSTLYIVFAIKSNEIDSEYLVAYYETNKWHRKVAECAAEGARNHGLLNISATDFFETKLKYPFEIGEQSKIGTLFKQLDNLITLHQRKHDKIVNIKKALLEKMFPSDAETTPKIRFKGFTDAWEQRKAETLFISYAEKGYPELPVLSATQDKGMVYRDDTRKNIFHDKSNEIGYKRVQPGQFVIHLRSFQGGFAHSAILGITSPAYTIFGVKEGEKQYDMYWKYVFSSPEFVKRLETVTYGIRDGRNISYDEFLTMKFLVPKYEEQVEIADSLIKIDNLITLHQRQLEKLKNIKSALLEKMFV